MTSSRPRPRGVNAGPAGAVDAGPTGRYRLGSGSAELGNWAAPLAYADLAEAVVDQFDRPTHHRDLVAVYSP